MVNIADVIEIIRIAENAGSRQIGGEASIGAGGNPAALHIRIVGDGNMCYIVEQRDRNSARNQNLEVKNEDTFIPCKRL